SRTDTTPATSSTSTTTSRRHSWPTQLQSRRRLQPAPDPPAQRAGCSACRAVSAHRADVSLPLRRPHSWVAFNCAGCQTGDHDVVYVGMRKAMRAAVVLEGGNHPALGLDRREPAEARVLQDLERRIVS